MIKTQSNSVREEKGFSPYDVSLHSVDSSCFYKIGYDSKYEKLVVVFNSNTDYMYVYSDFIRKLKLSKKALMPTPSSI